eukprot:PLAT5667.4.p1 GENE.PLAT5667.4~~PLAT5667.4.p1  ORF type:complete len:373 (-),score=175.47 PLAT5667.4:161-1279(-)
MAEAVPVVPDESKAEEVKAALASVEVADLPVIDLADWLAGEESADVAATVAASLRDYGVLVVRDPRVSEEDNGAFLDMMEAYFAQPEEERMKDTRPDLSYQIGATPDHRELPRDHCSRMRAMPEEHKPVSLCPPELDPKWRYFWLVGPRPEETEFPSLNADPVIPAAFPDWGTVMDRWGSKMLAALTTAAEMAAVGLGLDKAAFTSQMENGPHLLAPTGSDFSIYDKEGSVLAGFHYDLNFLTIHGKSRFPGLYIWLRDGRKVLVRVPDQCLLIQAGKQMEYVTGGHIMAGFHEVVVGPETLGVIKRKREAGESLWRISSTMFGHMASDSTLKPLGRFDTEEARADYPPIKTGLQVRAELEAIKLASGSHDD